VCSLDMVAPAVRTAIVLWHALPSCILRLSHDGSAQFPVARLHPHFVSSPHRI
jgi:hypothetical protein